ncbi:MAG: hypothetical protein O2979_03280 [Proteobacteria bacterium]|nr:hypothetical protein [Pseudomonadota bacterium]
MDYRCPLCAKELGGRKLAHAIVARMDLDCRHCGARIRLNLHPLEMAVVLAGVAAFVAAAALAYRLQNQALLLAAIAITLAGATGMYLLERTWLRDWPRYASVPLRTGAGP